MDGLAGAGEQALRAFRGRFPGVQEQTYFDVAARGLLSLDARAAIDGYLDQRMYRGGDKSAMFETVERARAAFARLIGADADEVAFVKNISDGINAFATGLDWRAGENVVLCAALEHPANILPWHNLARTRGVLMKDVLPDPRGAMPVERMIDAIDEKTRAMAVSSVSFSPGFRTALKPLGAACRGRGVRLIVDAAQSAGILATDVAAEGVDVLLASTQKGLLGLYGMGFMYVRREIADGFTPIYLSRLGVALESEHEAASGGFQNFRYADGARRFDVGNYNYLAAAAAERAIGDLLALGPNLVEAHVTGLAARLRDGLAQLGAPVFRGRSPEEEAHIVAIGEDLADEHDQTNSQEMVLLHAFLIENRVVHSIRRGVLRLSLHAYNDASDVDRVLDLVRRQRAGG